LGQPFDNTVNLSLVQDDALNEFFGMSIAINSPSDPHKVEPIANARVPVFNRIIFAIFMRVEGLRGDARALIREQNVVFVLLENPE
jgi:hypothetical protein